MYYIMMMMIIIPEWAGNNISRSECFDWFAIVVCFLLNAWVERGGEEGEKWRGKGERKTKKII